MNKVIRCYFMTDLYISANVRHQLLFIESTCPHIPVLAATAPYASSHPAPPADHDVLSLKIMVADIHIEH
jgi:hypothetical protein